MLKAGMNAPDFSLTDDAGKPVTLKDLLAHGPLVLYFYPADFTPVCTAEACMFRDAGAILASAGVRVVGVSPQGHESHARFKKAHGLNFSLLSDPGRTAAKAYGATGMFGFLPFGVRRVTYLITKQGIIADAVAAEFSVGKHEEFAKRAIESIRAGS